MMWMSKKAIEISSLVIDGLQARYKMDDETVANYKDLLEQGAEFPPVIVFWDESLKQHYLADGFHRRAAYLAAGRHTIPAEFRPGTFRDALKYSLSANSTHGLTRTNADKRRAVSLALQDAEFVQLSDRQIAKLCGVTHPFVGGVREAMGMKSESNADLTDEQLLHLAAQLPADDLKHLYYLVTEPRYGSNKKLERRRFALNFESMLTITKQGRRLVALHAAADPFLALELEFAANGAYKGKEFGGVRSVLEEMYKVGNWVFRDSLSYNQIAWGHALTQAGYLQEYRPEAANAYERHYHITPAGCALLGKPELPIAPTPSVTEAPAPAPTSKMHEFTPQQKHELAVANRERQIKSVRDAFIRKMQLHDFWTEEFLKVFPAHELKAIESIMAAMRVRVESLTPLPAPVMETVTTSDQEGAA